MWFAIYYGLAVLFVYSGVNVGLSAAVFWGNSAVVNQLAPLILGSPLKTHGYFYIVAGLCLFYFMFTLLTFPETKVSNFKRAVSRTYRLKKRACNFHTPQ